MPPQASLIEAFLKIVVPSSQVATLCQIEKKKKQNIQHTGCGKGKDLVGHPDLNVTMHGPFLAHGLGAERLTI